MAMRRGWRAGAVLTGTLLVAGGCGDGSVASSGLAVTDLTKSASSCPVDLTAAAKAAGVKPDGRATGRTVKDPVPAITRIGGGVAECELSLSGGGELSVMVVAAGKGSPVPVLLPDLQRRAGMATADLSQVATSADSTQPGDLVALPGTAPVALVILPVSGKGDAAARVAAEDGPDRAQVEKVATALADDLS